MDHPPILGIDVGGTHLRVGVVRGREVVREARSVAHLSRRLIERDGEGAVDLVVGDLTAAARTALDANPDVEAVGFAVPGFFSTESGRLLRAPNLPGLEDADLKTPLEAALGLPVVIENDALAAAWGEWCLTWNGHQPSLLYVGLGTGVGSGLILRGRPWRGAWGFGTEIGHLRVEREGRPCGCGKCGCLEQYASASGVSQSYEERAGEPLGAVEIARRAREGDEHALAAFERAGDALGVGVAQTLVLLDVELVVVGGGMAAAFDLLEPALRSRVDEDVLPVLRARWTLRASAAGDRAGMLGAALLAAESR